MKKIINFFKKLILRRIINNTKCQKWTPALAKKVVKLEKELKKLDDKRKQKK